MDETTLLSLTIEELFKVFLAKERDLKDEKHIKDKDIEQVKYGINIKFSLYNYFKYKDSQQWGIFRQKPKSNIQRVYGKDYDMDEFDEEIQKRQSIMLNALLDYYAEDNDIVAMDTGSMKV